MQVLNEPISFLIRLALGRKSEKVKKYDGWVIREYEEGNTRTEITGKWVIGIKQH